MSAVNVPNLKPVKDTLNLEVDGVAQYIELPEAVYMPIIQNDEKYTGHDSDVHYDYSEPCINESCSSY